MRVLVACEESQAVVKEFRALGFEAYSCDILPCSGGHPEWHLQQDVTPLLKMKWDLIIAFPPCTHLSNSGARWFKEKQADGRQQEGTDFFMMFANADCPHIAIENPLGIMSSKYRKPDQMIDPYQFGHPVPKKTCLWLKGLPCLEPTDIVEHGGHKTFSTGTKRMSDWYYQTSCLPHDQRAAARSKTFDGVAKAMAAQWGSYLQSLSSIEEAMAPAM